ncbi:CofH family radical SAM protein [uncultured Rikenella sp.]|uniref:CofH family radical SAM protein n=1 Tax=uncultured Rikenella sp. TaxID=368003 RepID=UPI00260270F9|nr:CofH family radical SAM protein [uncultured Rikenella sp.]
MIDISHSYRKALAGEALTFHEALALWNDAPLAELMAAADAVRRRLHPGDTVTWQIDRNVNITNVCVSGCKFCSFHCRPADKERAYITTLDEYRAKIREMQALGGEQLLLQGGLHPKLDLTWYETLFSTLKSEFPNIKLHALGPPEIAHIARISGLGQDADGYRTVLERLMKAGLDSLPGAGAEILDNEIRKHISPGKCSADTWLEVMRAAHKLGLYTSATMMYGHVEQPEHRILHLLKIRDLQALKPEKAPGFLAFIAWPYQGRGTALEKEEGLSGGANTAEFLRMIALSRLVLNNIPNIQASWLTTGLAAGQMALHGGANDMGSIMIEENVVSATDFEGRTTIDASRMQQAIRDAGFTPALRNQRYELL